jgi:hypothetical protein
VIDDVDGSIGFDSRDELTVAYGAREDTVSVNEVIASTARLLLGWVTGTTSAKGLSRRFDD